MSTHDQQTLPMQLAVMRDYVRKRGWQVGIEIRDIGSGATMRPQREELLKPRVGVRSISWSFGGWTAGGGL